MVRPRNKAKLEISLFPFLDVLSGVIGVLAIVIIGMAINSVKNAVQNIELAKGDEEDKQATFVECRSDGLVVHPLQPEMKLEDAIIPLDELDVPRGRWQQLLRELAVNARRRHIVFLIRPKSGDNPGGVKSFEKARIMAIENQIDVGYEPVYDAGPIVVHQEDLLFDIETVEPSAEKKPEQPASADPPTPDSKEEAKTPSANTPPSNNPQSTKP